MTISGEKGNLPTKYAATEGFYDVISFEISTDELLKLKSKLNLMEGLVRYLVTAE
jgi:ribosomal protein S6